MSQETIKPYFAFNKYSLNVFDLLMEKDLGFPYDGAILENLWIYRSSNKDFITIENNDEGVIAVTFYTPNGFGGLTPTFIDMEKINSPVKLLKKLKKDFLVESEN